MFDSGLGCGRYSMDSAIGLSTMLAIGRTTSGHVERFHQMTSTSDCPFAGNLPCLWGSWPSGTIISSAPRRGGLPYEQYLKRFPAYLQQLTWRATANTSPWMGPGVDYQTGPSYWGEPGTNGQHSFYQLIHQGTRLILDFIASAAAQSLGRHHDILLAMFFAQTEALAFGKTQASESRGQPGLAVPPSLRDASNTISRRLRPHAGQLVASLRQRFSQGTLE